MSVRHHPSDDLLAGFAAGTLDQGRHVAVATHLFACPQCRAWTRAVENIGGAVLTGLPPSPLASDAFARMEARLGETMPSASAAVRPASGALDDVPGLPAFVRSYRVDGWKVIAPRVSLRPIVLPDAGDTRVFLLKSGPGTKMLEHTHTGLEMTCVLAGSFTHEGGRYGPGDFDLGDDTMDHRVMVDADEPCVCLVAMAGDLRLKGWIGRLVQPFVRM